MEKISNRYRLVYFLDGLGNGGAERLMVPMLQHLDRSRFAPRVCALQDHHGNPVAKDLRAVGVPVDSMPVAHLRDLTAVPRIIRYLRACRADLIHTQLDFSDILGNAAAKWLHLPSVSTIHTLPTLEHKLKSHARQKLVWACQRRWCDRVISVSAIVGKHYLRTSGNAAGKVAVIYNGIDLTRFQAVDKDRSHALRERLGIPSRAPLMITVAMLRPQKGIQELIEVLPVIIARIPDLYYLVVGCGPYSKNLLEAAKSKGVAERVMFAGLRRDIPDLLAISDLFVLPSATEALPTVLIEAMAARKPIVATDVGGVPEMIDNGESGLLVSPSDRAGLAGACMSLLNDPDRMREMGARGWAIAQEKFDIRAQVLKLERLYYTLLDAYER